MNKKLLLFCVTMLASVTMFAQNWDRPVASNYQFVTEMKNTLQANAPYWEGDTTVYYLYNVEADGFLTNATCPTHAQWATHAALKIGTGNKVMMAQYRLAPIIETDTTYYDSLIVETDPDTSYTKQFMKVDTVKITIPEWDGVTYKILDFYNGSWRGVFPTSTYAMFVDRGSQPDYMWNIKSMGNGVYRICVSDLNPEWNSHAADSLFGNPETYLGFNKSDNDYDPSLEESAIVMPLTPMLSITGKAYNPGAEEGERMEDAELAIDWKFMSEAEFNKYASHLKAWDYMANGDLDNYIVSVEDKYGTKIDLSKLRAFFDTTSPVLYEDIEAAIKEVEQAIRQYIIDTVFGDATDENPANITILMENAHLEKRNMDGWSITQGIGDNLKYQETDGNFATFTVDGESVRGYINNETGSWISGFIEAWLPAPGPLGNGTISQTIKGLPAGKYSFSCDAIACNQNAGKQDNVGVYLFAEGGGVSMKKSISTANEKPESVELTFISGGGDIIMGLMSQDSKANWMAADNFELWYYGPVEGDPYEAILKTNIASYEKQYPDIESLMANNDIKDAYLAELDNAKNCTEGFEKEDSVLAAAFNSLKQSVADYVRMESLMEEVHAKADAFENSDFPGLGEILGDYYEFDLRSAYEGCTADAAMIDTIAATMGKMIVEHITANVKPGDELTPLISNPAFDTNFDSWSTTGARPGFGGKGGNGQNGIGDIKVITESGCAEVFHNTFDMYQIVRNMPKGSFKLTCQAFERNDGGWKAQWEQGPKVGINAVLYANNFTQKVNHIMEGAQDEFIYRANDSDSYPSDEQWTEMAKFVPNSMDGANFYFNLGEDHQMYLVELNFTLPTAGDSIRIGLRNDYNNSWVIFDNFRLYYNGSDANAYKETIDVLSEKLNNVFENATGGKDAEQKVADALQALAQAVASNDGDKCLEAVTIGEEALAYAEKSIEDYAALEVAWGELSDNLVTYEETATPEVLAKANTVFNQIESALGKMDLTNEEVEALIDQAKYYGSALKIPNTSGASVDTPINLSEVIINSTFDTIGDFTGWSSGFGAGGTTSTNAECYQKGFDVYQDLAGLPAGYYVAYVQAFHRHGDSGTDYSKFSGAATSDKEAYFYATSSEGTAETEIAYCSAGAVSGDTDWIGGGTSTVGDKLVIPNTMAAFTIWSQQKNEEGVESVFDKYTDRARFYNHIVQIKVGEDGKLRIGVKKDGNIGADWCIFDNFRLYYLGAEADPAVDSSIQNIENTNKEVKGIYNLAGQKLAAPVKGLNIIDGKKYFVK